MAYVINRQEPLVHCCGQRACISLEGHLSSGATG